jgi:hypothetical protein
MSDDLKPMPTLAALRARRADILRLAERYHATNVRVFGSVARGDATPASDVDLMVDFNDAATLWDAVGLWQDLRDLLGCEVSLIGDDDKPTRFRQRIQKDLVAL